MPTLECLVGDVGRFENLHWGRRSGVYQAALDVAGLLSVEDFDAIINSALRWPAVRVVSGGKNVAPNVYCTATRIGSQNIDLVADPVKMLDQYRRGSTIVLQSLHRTWPTIARFASQLEAEISHTVQANAYLTPPGAVGLTPHTDGHDVLVVQLHGEKHWTVDGIEPLTLRPGRVLYLPRQTTHSARTAGTTSLHLTIGIHPTTTMTIARQAVASLTEHGRSDSLPLGYRTLSEAQMIEIVRRALATSGEALAALAPQSIAAKLTQERRPRDQSGEFAHAMVRAPVTTTSLVAVVDAPRTTLHRNDDGRITLSSPNGTLRLPATAYEGIALLIDSSHPTKVADLPGLDSAGQLVLANRLVDEGIATLAAP